MSNALASPPRPIPCSTVDRRVMLVGNFLSARTHVRSVCEELASRLSGSGWTVLTTSKQPNRLLRLADMMWSVWRQRHDYTVAQVDVYSGKAFVWAECVCRILRAAQKPYVLSLHGGNLPQYSRNQPGRVRRLLASASVVTVPSRYLGEQMKVYRDDLVLLPNAIDLSTYPFRLRRQPKPALVWLRAFHATYNPALAPQILAELKSQFPQATLAMIGSDKGDGSWQRTRQVATQVGVFESVQWCGGVPKADVPRYLGAGDVFLNTTNYDNTPVSVIEAMACGLCIASTNAGGLPYLLRDDETAFLAPPDNRAALTACVRRILTEPATAERLSANARRQAEEFDWKAIAPRWNELLAAIGG